jgi:tetrapyrrole methylase family protein/MazG family protein
MEHAPKDFLNQFDRAYQIIRILRGENGCPWDREQTLTSLKPNIVEEAYEVVDAIEHGDPEAIAEELGDVYLVATLMSYIAEQDDSFSVSDVLSGLSEKLIRRHPHVFSDSELDGSDAVVRQWEQIKTDLEGKPKKTSVLDRVRRSLPPLSRAFELQKKASKSGFDWPNSEGPLSKLREELGELEAEIGNIESPDRVSEELGDLLFSVVNLARHLGVDPSLALHGANRRFETRFRYVEKRFASEGKQMSADRIEEMESLWTEAKSSEGL